MGRTSKTFVFLLILIIAISCLTILTAKPAEAQTIPQPSVPEFTLKYIDNSYEVPPTATSTIDPYTGKTITTTIPGYQVEEKSIEIIVTNKPFTPYTDAEGNVVNIFYNVRYKGHFGGESDWITPFYKTIRNGIPGFTAKNPQSSSGYTTIIVPSEFRVGDVVDFQVQRMEGFHTPWEPLPMPMGTSKFTGQYSEWSNTQTITIPSADGSPAPSPTVPEFPFIAVLSLLIVIPLTTVIVKKRNRLKVYN